MALIFSESSVCECCGGLGLCVKIPYPPPTAAKYVCVSCINKKTFLSNGSVVAYTDLKGAIYEENPTITTWTPIQATKVVTPAVKKNECIYCGCKVAKGKGKMVSKTSTSTTYAPDIKQLYCDNCFEQVFFICSWCGNPHNKNIAIPTTHLYPQLYPEFFKNAVELSSKQDGTVAIYNITETCFITAKNKAGLTTEKTVVACAYCGCNCIKEEGQEKSYCLKCQKAKYSCSMCGAEHYYAEYSIKDKPVCKECYYYNPYHVCTNCGKPYINSIRDKTCITSTNVLCPECEKTYTSCAVCGSYIKTKTLTDVNRVVKDGFNLVVCNRCATTAVCSSCSKVVISYQSSIPTYCSTCLARELKTNKVQPYDYVTPTFFKHGHNKDTLYLGWENEMYIKDKAVGVKKTLAGIMQHYTDTQLYCVFDGSIGGKEVEHCKYGFELVSHLFTLSAAKKVNWVNSFKGCQLHPTCGMHVHLTREAFTTFHLYKFMMFVHLNTPFIDLIGERGENKYSKNLDGSMIVKNVKKKVTPKGADHILRRVKVNLCNKNTVELRFFASVVTQTKLFKNLEFAHALFYFSRDTSVKNLTAANFTSYVQSKGDKYKYLVNFINKNTTV